MILVSPTWVKDLSELRVHCLQGTESRASLPLASLAASLPRSPCDAAEAGGPPCHWLTAQASQVHCAGTEGFSAVMRFTAGGIHIFSNPCGMRLLQRHMLHSSS